VWSRTITVNSGGKTFANTGWRIGWVIGPKELLWPMSVDVFANVIGVSTPMQEAFAVGIEIEID
jgi:kynurenine aminotransferase